jgi:tetratricopeptide (TPR) repeat protein
MSHQPSAPGCSGSDPGSTGSGTEGSGAPWVAKSRSILAISCTRASATGSAFALPGSRSLPPDALEIARRGVALARQARNRHAEFLNIRMAGESLAYLGQATESIEVCEYGVLLGKELGDSYHTVARHALAFTYVLAAKYDQAVSLCVSLIETNRRIGNVWGEGQALGLLGDAYHGLGRYQKAVTALSDALSIFPHSF